MQVVWAPIVAVKLVKRCPRMGEHVQHPDGVITTLKSARTES